MAAGPSNPQREREWVKIVNHLTKLVIAHCQSRDDDLEAGFIVPGSELKWDFEPTGFGLTLFWCDLAVDERRLHFDVYTEFLEYQPNWEIKDDGVSTYDHGRYILFPWTKL
ncbi:hypothetical protein LINPERHAP2_LOCUS10824 [Linum perenne]